MDYNITEKEICQDDLLDIEVKQKFTSKRLASELLSLSYARLGYESKSDRVNNCGTLLEFRKPLGEASEPPYSKAVPAEAVGASEGWKLYNANFCRDRLCPMCSWRRTYKVYAQISQIMNLIQNDYVFLFLTLTVPNCSADDLVDTIDALQIGWQRFRHFKRFKNAVQGFFKVLEITRNTDKSSPFYNTYHPHFHCILAVKHKYLKSKDYINHDEWLDMWRSAMNNPLITQVDIRRCKNKKEIVEGEQAVKSLGSAVAEIAKYSVKASDFLGRYNKDGFLVSPFPDDEIDNAVFTFSAALHHRRLVSLGGVFDEAAKRLQLDDIENGNLIHLDNSEIRADVAYMIRKYSWSCGVYKLIDEYKHFDVEVDYDE